MSTVVEQVRDCLAGCHRASVKQISKHTGRAESTVRRALKSMIGIDKVAGSRPALYLLDVRLRGKAADTIIVDDPMVQIKPEDEISPERLKQRTRDDAALASVHKEQTKAAEELVAKLPLHQVERLAKLLPDDGSIDHDYGHQVIPPTNSPKPKGKKVEVGLTPDMTKEEATAAVQRAMNPSHGCRLRKPTRRQHKANAARKRARKSKKRNRR